MARGDLPSQTPVVPKESFVAFDLLYTFAKNMSQDLAYLEGRSRRADYTIASSTVLVQDQILQFNMLPQRKYRVHGEFYFTANSKMRHFGPAGAVLVLLDRRLSDTVGSSTAFDVAYSAADIVLANIGRLTLQGIITNGNTAGAFGVSFAQNASNATPSKLYTGSVLRYSPID